ncbi:MAG: hypothetical protein J4G10_04735 [Alphaproteobacteria bacterium]|nr:hypothetical protein [Alphaproteobacteria bacterium]
MNFLKIEEKIEQIRPFPGAPAGTAALGPEARLLLEAVRLAAAGESPRPLLCLALGEVAGVTAAHALEGFLRLLARAARRVPRLPPPMTKTVALPERLLLDLVAALQADHATLSAALLAWLFPAEEVRAAAMHARLLAAALASAERRLPLNVPAPPPAPRAKQVERALALVV